MNSIICGWLQVWFGLILIAYTIADCPFPEENLQNGGFVYQSPEDINDEYAAEGYILKIHCFDGHKRRGPQSIVCSDGDWSPKIPICENCPFYKEELKNGQIVYQDPEDVNKTIANENYVLQFHCNEEYVRIGPRVTVCSDGEWSDYLPVCEKMECNDPPKIRYGRYKLHSGVKKLPTIGSSVVYTCISSYELVNESESTLRCMLDSVTKSATWIGETPACQEKNSCPDPGVSKDGTRIGNRFLKGDILEFSCNEDFELIGSEKIECLQNSSWSSKRPLCRPKGDYCELPPPIPHGFARLIGGEKMMHDYFFPYDEVEILCEPGYSYKGPLQFVMCEEGGAWEEEFGECTEHFCDYPKAITNGTIPELLSTNLTSFPYNFEITYTCNTGFRLVGADSWRFCDKKGWSGKTPHCEEVQCPDPGAPDDGSIHAESFKVGAKIYFKCNTGYYLLGSFERYCMPNGQWTGELASCDTESNYCPNPGIPINGFKNSTNYDLGEKIGFSCRSGYVLRGSEARECQHDKTWSGKETTCIGPYDYDNNAQVRDSLKIAVIEKANKQKQEEEEYFEALNSTSIRGRVLDVNHPGRLILYFIFDASGSVGAANFKKSIEFAKAIVKRVGIKEHGARCGAMTFSSNAKIEFIPVDNEDTESVLNALDAIEYTGGGTSTSSSLTLVKEELIPLTEGVFGKKGIKSVVFLLTDGRANMGGNPKEEADILKKAGIEIYCIGITGDVNKKALYDLASDSEKEPHVFILESYSTLSWLVQDLTNGTVDYSECGLGLEKVGIETRGKILGGGKASDPWPWMAAIYFLPYGSKNPAEADLQCGGSIIHKKFILTAAHCLYIDKNKGDKGKKADFVKRNNGEIHVKLGLTDVKNLSYIQEPEISRFIIHKNYAHGTNFFDYDIALLELKEPIEFNAHVRPICLPPLELPENSAFYKANNRGVATGWGYEGVVRQGKPVKMKSTDHLKELIMPIQSRDRCNASLKGRNHQKNYPFTDRMFCAGDGLRGTDTCQGDSGGPWMQSELNSEGYLYWTQVGIVSWGIGCGVEGTYGFYTHVQQLRAWIDETIKNAENEVE